MRHTGAHSMRRGPQRRRVVAHLLRPLRSKSDQWLDYLPAMFFMNQDTSGVPQPVVRSYP